MCRAGGRRCRGGSHHRSAATHRKRVSRARRKLREAKSSGDAAAIAAAQERLDNLATLAAQDETAGQAGDVTTTPEAAKRPAVWLSPQGDVLASQGETGVVVGDRHESLTFESNAPTVHMNQNGQTHTITVGGRAHFTFDADQGGDVTGGPGATVHNTNVVSGNARVGAQYNVRYGDGRATSRTTYSTSDDRQAEHIRREAERVQREIEHAAQAATAAGDRVHNVNTASGDDVVTQQTGVTFHRNGDRFSNTGSGRVFVNGKQIR